ncbi:Lytic murein transglycosylase [Rubrivivax sp. A210]|uniref:lytic murein transglycosylase n=1 Tax=Rubrivivax sp. A210 TaxID=2772301 RepID=UPI001919AFDC|nr:lytic murein transglycosylase [Rubrivivax sp. A210]CAD5372699.1 Lytic murein transglycosylase [Rubrivivax sp. A210]
MRNPVLDLSRCQPWATLALAALAGCAQAPPTALPAADASPATEAAPAPTASLSEAPTPEQAFARWIADFRATARAEGISEATLAAAFDGVRLLPRVIDADRSQPEFNRSVWDYLDRAVSAQRIAQGQEQLAKAGAEAEAAAARYGVPAPVLVAIWGMESNYGGNAGDIPTLDALATLGFEGRREAFARRELLAALKIIDQGDIDRARMLGSWAGAMGQTQFMPSSLLAYAVDADGDGRRDIWGSLADVLASTANFLARAGWRAGEPWGLEVALPPGFDLARADPATRQPAARWAEEGLRAVDGAPLAELQDAAVLLPAGVRGPAFLVGANWRALLRYNNSTSYGLAVGLLAQRIAGGPGVQAAWPRDQAALSRSQLQALQDALNQRGFDAGKPDGLMGPATRAALRRWQLSAGLPADGHPTAELLQRLQAP